MIKRINKIVALILIAACVATITPSNTFSEMANAAENGQGQQINIDKQDAAIMKALKEYLIGEYSDKGCVAVKLGDTPVQSIPLVITESMADKMVSVLVTDQKVEDGVREKLKVAGMSDQGIEEYIANMKSSGEFEKTKQEAIKDEKAKIISLNGQAIPIYQYAALASDGTVVGKGYVIGGQIGYALIQSGKPIYVDADILNSSVLGQLKAKIEEALKNANSSISNIIGGITGAIGDFSDAVEDLSDSLNDKSDDLDDAWDKVFDRFDNDEGWGKRDGYIYYYDEDGVSLKGVQKINGKTYYFNRIDGAMETGWQIVDGKRCYFDKKKGYQLSMQWVKDGDDWYFLGEDGAVKKSEWIQTSGKTYYVKADGKMTKGWLKVKDYWYFFNDDGSMATSTWKWSSDSWYYLKEDGAAATDWLQLGGNWYCFKDPSGAMQTGWFRNDGNWYCSNNDGSMKTGWAWSEDGYSYLDEATGKMKKNEWVTVDGKTYYFNVNGIMVTGSRYIDGKKYIFNADGSVQ